MRKTIILLIFIMMSYTFISSISEEVLIPEEAIRMRIIANSDSEYDQSIKLKVRNKVQEKMYNYLKNTKKIEEARKRINNELPNLKNEINEILINENYNLPLSIEFSNHFFPEKKYKGVVYKEGMYESLVVTLGKGEGKNWWCVLFPPLCLIEAEESNENVEYKSFVKEMIEKYF